MKNILRTIASTIAVFGIVAVGLATPVGATAADSEACIGAQMIQGKSEEDAKAACSDDATLQSGFTGFIKKVIDILLFLIGAIAVVMIIIGGIRYTTSNGDASQTKAAKDTILYSIVGLVVAIMAYAVVGWILGAL